MIHSVKLFALVLAAAFVVSVASAPFAVAAEETKPGLFTAAVGATEQANIDAEQTAAGKTTLTIGPVTITCTTVIGVGEPVKTKASPEEHVVAGPQSGPQSTDITLSPTYAGCHTVVAGLTKTVTITTNGCAYVFDAKTTVTEGGSFDHTAAMSIECPTGRQIEIHIYEGKESEVTTLCTYDIKPQTTLTSVTLVNDPNIFSADDVLATYNVGISVVNTKLSALCGQNAQAAGVYKGEDTVRATNAKGEFVDASISD